MDNPLRTADYLARRDTRLTALRTLLACSLTAPEITLEIGCGHGHFLTAYAEAHPTAFCVGIDIMLDRVHRAERKRKRSGLPNLIFVRAEVFEFLESLPETIHLADIFILFPDPWPKRRHHKNRIIQPRLLDILGAKATTGARFCFRTDHAPYFKEGRSIICAHSQWETDPTLSWPFELTTVFQARAQAYESFVARRCSG